MGKKWWGSLMLAALLGGMVGCGKVDSGQNLKAGESFLAENRTKPGVLTTASGLQYQVLQDGKGVKPGATDSVTVNYQGSLITGKEFDQGENISFP